MILKLIGMMLFLQCFVYKNTGFGPSFAFGLTVTPDRLVFILILLVGAWKLTSGELRLARIGPVGYWMLLFTLVCTVSTFAMGAGSLVLHHLFDFTYHPFLIFILAKSIPHDRGKLESLSLPFLPVGAYLAINGAFEHLGLHALVWPKYILDPTVGIQFGRTRGPFVSSEAFGMAIIVSFLFHALYTTRVKGSKLYWAYLMLFLTAGVIYTTYQRSAWLSFGLCLLLLAIARTEMRQVGRVFLGLVLLGYVLGVGTHFSLWESTTLLSRRQDTVNYRQVNDLTTLAMGLANPIFGVGYGNFKREWSKYFRPIAGDEIYDLRDGNHNTFLGLFAEVGLVGLIPYLFILHYMLRVGLRAYANAEGFERGFSLIFLLVMVSYLVGANLSDYRSGQFFTTTLFLMFGSVAAMDLQKAPAWEPAPKNYVAYQSRA